MLRVGHPDLGRAPIALRQQRLGDWHTETYGSIAVVKCKGTVAVAERTSEHMFKLFPKPAMDHFHLESVGGGKSLMVFYAAGQRVSHFELE